MGPRGGLWDLEVGAQAREITFSVGALWPLVLLSLDLTDGPFSCSSRDKEIGGVPVHPRKAEQRGIWGPLLGVGVAGTSLVQIRRLPGEGAAGRPGAEVGEPPVPGLGGRATILTWMVLLFPETSQPGKIQGLVEGLMGLQEPRDWNGSGCEWRGTVCIFLFSSLCGIHVHLCPVAGPVGRGVSGQWCAPCVCM